MTSKCKTCGEQCGLGVLCPECSKVASRGSKSGKQSLSSEIDKYGKLWDWQVKEAIKRLKEVLRKEHQEDYSDISEHTFDEIDKIFGKDLV